ncbi:hypothetical protein M9H77_08104 [Catharanthus roseus]|uniref:Uncharacterized protein n=1 Tax=Catharanthus roseus TaxID=4058 RepID=A0ACC0BX21_CATRO|nr:hypothetical protein M9H77_08104 [Catharanthus roseus]
MGKEIKISVSSPSTFTHLASLQSELQFPTPAPKTPLSDRFTSVAITDQHRVLPVADTLLAYVQGRDPFIVVPLPPLAAAAPLHQLI